MYKNLADLPLQKWMAIYDAFKMPSETESDNFEKTLALTAIINDIEDIDSISTEKLRELLPSLKVLSIPIRKEFPRSIKVNGRRYRVFYSMNKVPAKNLIRISRYDLSTVDQIVSSVPEIVALLTNGEDFDITAEDMKCARFGQVYPVFLFNLKAILALAKKAHPDAQEILKSVNLN